MSLKLTELKCVIFIISNKTFHFVDIANVTKFCINVGVIAFPRCSRSFINTFSHNVFPVWGYQKDIQWGL